MAPGYWISSLACATSDIQSPGEWSRFIFLSPCPQRSLFAAIDLIFLFVFFVFTVQKLYSRFRSSGISESSIEKPLLERRRNHLRSTPWFKLSLILTVLLAISDALGILTVT